MSPELKRIVNDIKEKEPERPNNIYNPQMTEEHLAEEYFFKKGASSLQLLHLPTRYRRIIILITIIFLLYY
jgi:hypothetical protein